LVAVYRLSFVLVLFFVTVVNCAHKLCLYFYLFLFSHCLNVVSVGVAAEWTESVIHIDTNVADLAFCCVHYFSLSS